MNEIQAPETQSTEGGDKLTKLLVTPIYHERLRDHFRATEPELWSWFSDAAAPSDTEIEEAELDLLKTCYRLDGGLYGDVAAYATLTAGRLGLDPDIMLYQELNTDDRNARVVQLGDTIHIVFGGDLLDLLDGSERQFVLAHELAHVALWTRENRDFKILNHLLHRIESEPLAHDVLRETTRRLRLHTEVWADAVATELTAELNASISAIVKVNAGLRNVDPDAYLRQARQILEADPSSSQGWTHPELHVRVACLAALASPNQGQIVAELIEGPDDLDRLDVFGQHRLMELIGKVLRSARQVAVDLGVDLEAIDLFQADYTDLNRDAELSDAELSDAEPSVRYLCAAVLVDHSLIGDGIGASSNELRAYAEEAQRVGIGTEFDKILGRATKKTAAEIRRIRTGSPTDHPQPDAADGRTS